MLKEFKAFAMRGNVVDLAVGVIIGGGFGAIVNSLVNDIIMPPIGLVLGKVDFANLLLVWKEGTVPPPYATVADAATAGAVTLNYGVFINAIVSFLIVAFCVFLMVKGINKLQPKPAAEPAAPATKDCPYCATAIPLKASRCPHCTSEIS